MEKRPKKTVDIIVNTIVFTIMSTVDKYSYTSKTGYKT